MVSRLVSATAVMLTASSLVTAQTYSSCNPIKQSGCPADTAVGTTTTIDFTKGENDFFTSAVGTSVTYDPSLGAVFTINKETDAPTFTSKGYIFFGKVDVTVRASLGTGVVTSFVLQSDDLDEIDWEWLGGDDTQVQTNYFSKGDTTTYDRGGFSGVGNPQTEFHTYTIDWNADRINWIVDGAIVRTLTYADAKNGATYPQTPMQIKLGTWDAGRKDAAQGTVEWAGGYTDFTQAPFNGYYKSVTVQDYSNGATNAGEYVYGDTTGTYKSIKIKSGDDSSDSSSSSSQSAASTAAASSTAASTDASSTDASSTDASSTDASSATSQGASSTPTTLSTVTASTTSGITLATDGSKSSASKSGSSGSTTASSSGSSSSSTVATVSSGNKSAVNLAFLGAAFFAFLSL